MEPKFIAALEAFTSKISSFNHENRSGGSVVDHTIDYQSRDSKIDPLLLRSFGSDFKLRSHLHIILLLVGR